MVSNKTLAILVVTAVVISLAGTLLSMNKLDQLASLKKIGAGLKPTTGLVTSTGQVNLTIGSYAACNVDTNVDFGGSGAPSGQSNISTDAQNNQNSMTFNDCRNAAGTNNCKGLTVNNTGNANLTIQYNSTENATGFLVAQTGLSQDDFTYYLRNGTWADAAQGCRQLANTTGNVTNGAWIMICQKLTPTSFAAGLTALTMEFNVTIEPTISQGVKLTNITINCGDIGD